MKKVKVGVLTLDGLNNYGNRLQNLAVQYVYESHGCECITIICDGEPIKNRLKYIRSVLNDIRNNTKKTINFSSFNKRFIKIRKYYGKNYHLPNAIAGDYDFFSVGSDQVWNPNIRKKEKFNYFLKFCSEEQRIAFSPSIAVDSIPEEYLEEYISGLKGFPILSVRENNGATLIEKLIGKTPEVLVDPTLALSSIEWDNLLGLKKNSDNYLLLYFLGEIKKDIMDEIVQFAQRQGLEIKSAYVKKGMNQFNSYDPKDFVSLIKNAKCVFTDSFHGTAFSVNYNIPFYTFLRYDPSIEIPPMEARITTLLDKLNLVNRFVNHVPHSLEQIDFSYANKCLYDERIKVSRYIRKSLRQKGD